MKLKIKAGTTSRLARVFIQDSSSTVGAGLTGLVHNSASLTWYYSRVGAASATQVTLASGTLGTWSSGGFIAVDGTNMPGVYEIGIPDAALAGGATAVHMLLKGAANMAPVPVEIELDAVDYQDSVRAGLTALPNAAANSNGGLPILSGSGTTLGYTVTTTTNLTNPPGVILAEGTVQTGTSATQFTATGASLSDTTGAYEDPPQFVLFQTGDLTGERKNLASYSWSAGVASITVATGFSGTPAPGDTFVIG